MIEEVTGPETLADESNPAPDGSEEETREVSVEAMAAVDSVSHSGPDFEIGAKLGRYVLLKELGRGGMAVVHVAYDPELDRKVALKLVRPRRGSKRSADQERLLREAQALARLSHPNVVHVYDVGIYEAHVYIAMELVAGQTLRAWLSEAPRSWREVLDLYVRAGQGLAAAHAADLVHLDFKPGNVVLGKDKRVRVVDFGLARESRGSMSGESGILERVPEIASVRATDLETITGSHRLLGEQLTEYGSIMGTPGYIAPEQLLGHNPDARADQFSFCVALWEGLFGDRPFAASERKTLQQVVLAGQITPPPMDRRVPHWLRRIVERGLSPRPEERFADMNALLDALGRDPARRRRRIAGWIVGAAAIGTAGLAWGRAMTGQATHCTSGEEKMAEVWTPTRSDAAGAAFHATGLPFAEDAWRGAQAALERHASVWTQTYLDACEATHVRGEQSAELLDLRMHCLERTRTELNALIEVFIEADDDVVRNAAEAVAKLTSIARCNDAAALRAEGRPDDPALRQVVDALDLELARATGLLNAGLRRQGLATASSILEQAQALEHPALEARAALGVAAAYTDLGQHDDTIRMLDQALFAAERAGLDRLRVRALITLGYTVGYIGAEHDRGTWLLQVAREILDRIEEHGELLANLLSTSAVLDVARGRPDEALAQLHQALDMHRSVEPSGTNIAVLLLNLGGVHFEKGEYDLALGYYEEAHELTVDVYGDKHPALCETLENLGNVLHAMGRSKDALAQHRQGIEICEAGGAGAGMPHALRLNNEATVLTALARHDEALTRYRAALALIEDKPGHPARGVILSNMAESYIGLSRNAEALELFEKGMAILADATGDETIYYAAARAGLGHALLELGRDDEAVAALQAALDVFEHATADAQMRAEVEFNLARALVASADDRDTLERARSLVERAHATSRGAGERGARLYAASKIWLKSDRSAR
jgi:eukaryotic-like serine/threonine-protein kinase